MIRGGVFALVVVAVAIGGGGASVWYALKMQDGIGAIRVGQWTAFPDIGTPDADPYSKARVAREGVLPLGQAEGLTFVAGSDADGAPLRRECAYSVSGALPPARFWTLYAADTSLDVIRTGKMRSATMQSYQALRQPDNSLEISVGGHPAPGNWLLSGGAGEMFLVLTFYDTPIATSTGLSDLALPAIKKTGCDA